MLNYEDAKRYLEEGFAIESYVSKTVYQLNNGVLIADGLLVNKDYITLEEINGDWEAVFLIERSLEEIDTISNEELNEIFENATTNFMFNIKYGR